MISCPPPLSFFPTSVQVYSENDSAPKFRASVLKAAELPENADYEILHNTMHQLHIGTSNKMVCNILENGTQPNAYTKPRSGYRAIGRPRKRWMHNILDILYKRGYSAAETTSLVLGLLPQLLTAGLDQQYHHAPWTRHHAPGTRKWTTDPQFKRSGRPQAVLVGYRNPPIDRKLNPGHIPGARLHVALCHRGS